jgi:4-hydroxybenzoate polyprenyltransferase
VRRKFTTMPAAVVQTWVAKQTSRRMNIMAFNAEGLLSLRGQARRMGDTATRSACALIIALRPRQWIKNGLIFAPLAFTASLHRPELLMRTMIAFVLFCALSSAGYLLNDVADIEADRAHPTKRFRPIAAGLVPIRFALVLGVILACSGVIGALALTPALGALAVAYLTLTAAYTLVIKHIVLLDVFAIAAGFVLRAVAGAAAIQVPVSPWLYIATMLGAMLIALGKRRAELLTLGIGAVSHRRNLHAYSVELIDQLMLIISSAALMTYSLYTFSADNLPKDHSMMLTIPVVLYGIFRYLLLSRKGGAGTPEDLLIHDRPLLATVTLWAALAVGILYRAVNS